MWKRLHEKGLLASKDVARGHNTTRATIDGNRKTVIHLIPGALLPEDDPNGPNGFELGAVSRVGDTMLMSQLLRGLRPGKEGK
jgi:hypothetical protein